MRAQHFQSDKTKTQIMNLKRFTIFKCLNPKKLGCLYKFKMIRVSLQAAFIGKTCGIGAPPSSPSLLRHTSMDRGRTHGWTEAPSQMATKKYGVFIISIHKLKKWNFRNLDRSCHVF